ncbi:hypothetical protein D3C79_961060 [compost metagenome]
MLGVLGDVGRDLMHLAGQLVQLLHHLIALIHHQLGGAGAVMDLLHLLHHLLQTRRYAGELARLLLLILLQSQD